MSASSTSAIASTTSNAAASTTSASTAATNASSVTNASDPTVDTMHANRAVWLVRIPEFVKEAWSKMPGDVRLLFCCIYFQFIYLLMP